MNYEITIRDIEPIQVAYLKYQGIATEANKVFPNVFKSIRGKSNGAPLFNYLSLNPETKEGEIELCVPTSETPNGNGISLKMLPRIKALCVTHVGSYESLSLAYGALQQYATRHNIILAPPYREIYIKGPGMLLKGNSDKYITEIQFPIKED